MTKKLTIKEAIETLALSEKTIRRRIASGELKAEKFDGRWYVYLLGQDDHQLGQNDHLSGQDDQSTGQADHAVDQPEMAAELRTQIEYLKEQLRGRDQHIDHLTQLLALKEKNVAALTEQLDDSRRLIEDMRRPWWKRLFRQGEG